MVPEKDLATFQERLSPSMSRGTDSWPIADGPRTGNGAGTCWEENIPVSRDLLGLASPLLLSMLPKPVHVSVDTYRPYYFMFF